MSASENDPVLLGLRALLAQPVVVEQLAATATRRFGGYPITKSDVQDSATVLIRFLAGEQVEFAPVKAGTTASCMKRFSGEGSPEASAASFAAAQRNSALELPLWLLEETRRLVRQESERRVQKGSAALESDMLYKAEGVGQSMVTKRAADMVDLVGRAGTVVQRQHGVNEATRKQRGELVHLRKMADTSSDPALREGYTRRADAVEAALDAGLPHLAVK